MFLPFCYPVVPDFAEHSVAQQSEWTFNPGSPIPASILSNGDCLYLMRFPSMRLAPPLTTPVHVEFCELK